MNLLAIAPRTTGPLAAHLGILAVGRNGDTAEQLLDGLGEIFAAAGRSLPAGTAVAEADADLWAVVRARADNPAAMAQVVVEIGADGIARQYRQRFSVERVGSLVYGSSLRGENGGNLGLRRVRDNATGQVR